MKSSQRSHFIFFHKQTSEISEVVPAVSTTGEIEQGHIEGDENPGESETMIVEEEKTAEDALPGGR